MALVLNRYILPLVQYFRDLCLSKLLTAFIEPALELSLVLGDGAQERLVLLREQVPLKGAASSLPGVRRKGGACVALLIWPWLRLDTLRSLHECAHGVLPSGFTLHFYLLSNEP